MSKFTDGITAAAFDEYEGLLFGEAGNLQRRKWRDIYSDSRKVAGRLLHEGVQPSHRVGVLAAYAEDVAPVAHGIWMVGASLTMLQQPTPQADLGEWYSKTLSALTMLGAQFVIVGKPFSTVSDGLRTAGYHVIEIPSQWPDNPIADIDIAVTAEDDIALYQLTSGSTGDPKGVAITHGNLYANTMAMEAGSEGKLEKDSMMSWLPLSHDMGLVGFLLTPMFYGGKAVYIAPTEFLKSPLNWIKILSDEKITITAGPNFAYSIVHRRLKAVDDGTYDLSSLRFALCGAEPIDPETVAEFTRQASRFGMHDNAVIAAYGMAEATLAVSFSQLRTGVTVEKVRADVVETTGRAISTNEPDVSTKDMVVLGPPLLGMEVKIVDSNATSLQTRHLGEILIRGDAVTRHYAIPGGHELAIDNDGWLHTGDIGYLTEHGEVVVGGRSKNIIIVAGRNIFPAEIERIAESAEGIRRGAVVAFGVTLPDYREEIRIVAETKQHYNPETTREIRSQIARKVFRATGLSPDVVLVDKGTIPKTPSGKIRHTIAKQTFGKVG